MVPSGLLTEHENLAVFMYMATKQTANCPFSTVTRLKNSKTPVASAFSLGVPAGGTPSLGLATQQTRATVTVAQSGFVGLGSAQGLQVLGRGGLNHNFGPV